MDGAEIVEEDESRGDKEVKVLGKRLEDLDEVVMDS